jgi:hypothetical protein
MEWFGLIKIGPSPLLHETQMARTHCLTQSKRLKPVKEVTAAVLRLSKPQTTPGGSAFAPARILKQKFGVFPHSGLVRKHRTSDTDAPHLCLVQLPQAANERRKNQMKASRTGASNCPAF